MRIRLFHATTPAEQLQQCNTYRYRHRHRGRSQYYRKDRQDCEGGRGLSGGGNEVAATTVIPIQDLERIKRPISPWARPPIGLKLVGKF